METSKVQQPIVVDEKAPSATDGSLEAQEGPIGAIETQKPRTLRQKILGVVWDTFDKSPEERRFLTKADTWIMTYICVAYFVKYLDQTNVVNAYVSGMKEDLGMSGNDYNYMQTLFNVGYILGNLPSQMIMTKIRPSIWLPTLELIWSVLVMAMAASKNTTTLFVLRFFIGFLEASAYPGIMTLLGSWYTPAELGKRASIFQASSSVAQMFSGYLQAALYSGMDGKHGLRAWQWLVYIPLEGMTLIVATRREYANFCAFAIPDSPTNSKARWLSESDRAIGVQRMEAIGRKPPKKLTWKIVKEVFTSWPVYLFSIAFTGHLIGVRIYNYFNIYLKATGRYSVEQINIIPTGGFGIQIVCSLLYAWISDATQTRASVICVAALLSMVGTITLSIYPEYSNSAMLFGWFMTYCETGAAALILAWLNEVCSFSTEHRLVVIGVVETFGFAMNAWVILLAYDSSQAPKFAVGYELATMFFAIEIVACVVIALCYKKWNPAVKHDR